MKPQITQRPNWFEKQYHSDLRSKGGGSAWKKRRATLSVEKRASRKSERARLKTLDFKIRKNDSDA
jgi:hypothetical protein